MSQYTMDGFMNWLYQERFEAPNAIEQCGKEEFLQVQRQKRETLRRALGIDKLEQMSRGVTVRMLGEQPGDGYRREDYTIEFLPHLTVPFYVLYPLGESKKAADGSDRTVLYCHGHGEGGCQDCFVEREPRAYHKNLPLELARRGYRTVFFEPEAFGGLIYEGYAMNRFEEAVTENCYPLATQLLMYGITLVGLRVFTVMKLVDYLIDDCGCSEVITAGISGGGMLDAFHAALSDRIKANIICCYTNTFRASIMSMYHCVDNYIPGIADVGEEPDIIALAAPKPMFISAGKSDPLFPFADTQKAVEIIRGVYRKLGVAERVQAEYFEGVHEMSFALIDWLDALQ